MIHSIPYNCPVLTCSNTLYKNRCLEVNFELPKDQTVRFGNCKGNKICNYRAESTYQWPVKPTLYLNMTDISTLDLWGYCIEPNSWENGQLLPGRSCNSDYQCYSSLCSDGKCKGLVYPAACRISKDCEAGYRCTPDYSYKPDRVARNVCVKVQTEGQNCTIDYDCQNQLICASNGKSKTCMRSYSLNVGDVAYDGRLCQTGAKNSKNQCALTSMIKFNSKTLNKPYLCTPDTEAKCEKFDSSGNSVTYQGDQMIANYQSSIDYCQCTNFSTSTQKSIAYCVPYGNSDWQSLWTYYGLKILPFIENCHIQDRFNPLAWLDCGKAIQEEDVTYFVNKYSQLSFYQFQNDGDNTTQCEEAISYMHSTNWNKLLNGVTYISSNSFASSLIHSALSLLVLTIMNL